MSGELIPVFLPHLGLVQRSKIRPLVLSLHVTDLAGIRNLKKMVKAESRVGNWLQSINRPGLFF